MPASDLQAEPWALLGARVWTGAGFEAEAISFDARGRVGAVGSERAVLASLPASARRVGARGFTVVPGFIDAHTHVRAAAGVGLGRDCGGARDAGELLRLASRARDEETGPVITLVGLNSGTLPTLPTRAELDRIDPERPLRIRDRSLHAWLLNTPAARIAAAGTGRRPEDGLVADHSGEIRRSFGRITDPAAFEAAVRAWSQGRLREGLTGLLDAGAGNTGEDVRALGEWRRAGALAQHTAALVAESAGSVDSDPEVRVAGTKLIFGAESRDVASARRRLLGAWDSRPLAAVHCADLEALGDVLEAVAGLPSRRRRGLRLEHASIAPPEWIPRVAAAGAGVVTQPAFVTAHGDRYRRSFAVPFHPWLYRQRSWIEAGVPFAAGSDEPAGPGSPLLAWRAAVDRRCGSGEVLGASEALSAEQGLCALTSWAADACGLSDLGRLLPGKRGCAVVLSGDPLGQAGPGAAEAVLTVLDGRPVPDPEPTLDVE